MDNKNLLRLMTIIIIGNLLLAENLGGKVFFDYSHSTKEENINGFGLSRVYLTVKKEIADNINFKFQSDIDYKNAPKNLYIKNAKVDWKTNFGKIVIGLQGMNMYSIQENNWGYRFLEKSPMDLHKFSSSADLGIGYYNSMGKISYSGLITNGSGYKKSESDNHKKISFSVLYGQNKLSSKNRFNLGGAFSYEPYDSDTVTVENTMVAGIYGSFSVADFRVGGELNQKTVSKDSDNKTTVTSVYGNYSLNKSLSIFGRFDIETETESENYLIAGISFSPSKGLVIAPNYRTKNTIVEYAVNFQFKF